VSAALVRGLGVALLLCASASHAGEASAPALDRSGPVHVGQTFAELAARGGWQRDPDIASPGCFYARAGTLPKGVDMMVLGDRVVRFDVGDKAVAGPFGIRIGDGEAAARGRLPAGYSVDPHAYGDADDHYLTWRDPQGALAVRYETMRGKVSAMYWGSWDAVQFIEGCA